MAKIHHLTAVALLALPALFASTPSWACACCGTWKVTGVASNDVLNIRSGPGVSYAKIGSIPPDTACVWKSAGCSGNWCRVSYAGVEGWANTRYLTYFAKP
ncbi:MAG: SH3 domain-containing protein [Hyphomicrobiaceae bacterium]